MRFSTTLLTTGLFAIAALLSLVGARVAVSVVETLSVDGVQDELVLQGYDWAEVQGDGLAVVVSGTAPSEVLRFRAISAAGTVVDAARVIDNMQVPAAKEIEPPRFTLEILRNDDGISLIGLIPATADRTGLNDRIKRIAGRTHVTDLMGAADYPEPKNWDAALEFAVTALETLPRAKISMDARRVSITAVSDSIQQKTEWERVLKRAAPRSLLLLMDISAPRPVITPFTLRFLIEEGVPRFDACSVHDNMGRAKIAAAAVQAGLQGGTECTIGLGVPSPDWPDAVTAGISAVGKFGGGSVTYSDADVTLVAPAGTAQGQFDRVVGELEAELPTLYSLHAVLPEEVKIDGTGEEGDGPPEFVATRSPEGQVQLRGRLTDDLLLGAAESYAKARFGTGTVYAATRLDPDLPGSWPTRVLAALEALGYLANGAVVVQPDVVDVRGKTGDPDASAAISRILSEKLGAKQNFQVNVSYEKALDPVLGLPSPQECVAKINGMLAESKITFAPGSANIEASAADTLDKIAEVLKTCEDTRMEIAGYTDSQGREEMNKALSQSRAQAVLSALLARRVLTSNLAAKGYGEEDPIADNGSEEGREANRRIEFRLLDLPTETESPTTDEPGEDTPDAPATDPVAGEQDVAPIPEGDASTANDVAGPDSIANTPGADDPRPIPRPEAVPPTDTTTQ